MAYQLPLNNELVDNIMQHVLSDDYLGVISDIENLQSQEESLEDYEKQDLEDNLCWKAAFEVLLTYYLPHKSYTELFDRVNAIHNSQQ
jgi:hypothetical protein